MHCSFQRLAYPHILEHIHEHIHVAHSISLSLSLSHTHTHTHIHARGMKPQDIPLGDGTGKISTLKARVSLDSQVTENYFCYGVMITSQVLTLSYSWGRGEGGRGANRAMAPLRPSK